MAKIHIDLPDSLKHEFSMICESHDVSMAKVVRNHIEGYCKRFRKVNVVKEIAS